MKRNTIALLKLDARFGWLYRVCSALHRSSTRPGKPTTGNVYIIKLFGMGSLVRFLHLCEEEQRDLTAATLITLSSNKSVCELFGIPAVLIRTDSLVLFLRDCLRVIAMVRREVSLIIDLERCSNLVGIFRTCLSFGKPSRTISFETRSLKTSAIVIHDVNGLSMTDILRIGAQELPALSTARVSRITETDPGKVIININSSDLLVARKYGVTAFSELVRKLWQSNPSLHFYLTGTATEKPYVDQLEALTKELPVSNVAGQWSLSRLVAELSTCQFFVTCDSGPMHIAAYMNVATISIWGPTQAAHFGYVETPRFLPVSRHLGCSPCFLHPVSRPAEACGGAIDCLSGLLPSEIIDTSAQWIDALPAVREITFPSNWKAHALRPLDLEVVR